MQIYLYKFTELGRNCIKKRQFLSKMAHLCSFISILIRACPFNLKSSYILPLSSGHRLLPLLHHFGGIAGDDGEWWDIVGDDRIGGDDGVIANGDAGKDSGFIANPNIITNGDGAFMIQMTIERWNIGSQFVGAAMTIVSNCHPATNTF